MKKIYIVTLFPDYFLPWMKMGVVSSILGPSESGLPFEVELIDLRQFSKTKYKSVDDTPYGGGPGMVMRADVLANVFNECLLTKHARTDLHVVCPYPRGKTWSHEGAVQFAAEHLSDHKELVFICGRYEGIDERFLERYVDQFISLGDFILTGGELAVMAIMDSALRFVPNTLGNKLSALDESFASDQKLLEYPQYTRPVDFEGEKVPNILTSGHHKNIEEYKKSEAIRLTKKYRPDLLPRKKHEHS